MSLLDKYIGIPYEHRGRTIEGLDCWGLVVMVYRDLGFELDDLNDYEVPSHLTGNDYFRNRDDDSWRRVAIPSSYDVVLIVNQKGIAYHAGMITPDHKYIHCAKNTGVAIVSMENVRKVLIVEGFYRLKARDDNY